MQVREPQAGSAMHNSGLIFQVPASNGWGWEQVAGWDERAQTQGHPLSTMAQAYNRAPTPDPSKQPSSPCHASSSPSRPLDPGVRGGLPDAWVQGCPG